MCRSESCGSFHGGRLRTRRHPHPALFFFRSEINLPFQNPKLFAEVIAQLAGLSLCDCRAADVSRAFLAGR